MIQETNLTNATVVALEAGIYKDTKTAGLRLKVYKTGKRTWVYRRRLRGRCVDFTLGSPPAIYRDQAAKQIQRINADLLEDVTPWERKIKERSSTTTLKEFYAEFERNHLVPRVATYKKDAALWKHLTPLHHYHLCEIRRKDVIALHVKLGTNVGERTANKTVRYLRGMLNKAIDWELLHTNPVARINFYKDVKRKRFLEPHEEKKFFSALHEEDQIFQDLVMMALFTGARKQNLLRMRWDDIAWSRSVWVIPAGKTKTSEPYTIPLIDDAIQILKRRRLATIGDWVYPNEKTEKPWDDVTRWWYPFRDKAGVPDMRWHDLRRTFATKQAAQGTDLKQISAALCHADLSSTEVYAQINLEIVRDNVTRAMGGIGKQYRVVGGER